MTYRMIFNTLGRIAIVLAILLVIPAVLALSLGESSWWAIATTVGISLAIGLVLVLCIKPKDKTIFAKEGLIIVALSWIYVSAIGALPFVITPSPARLSYIDAFFEMCSGFSTTGATILDGSRIDALYATDKALLFWRSFTHWIGGMGVVVFLMAFETGSSDRGMHILRAEMPGPTVDKIVPRARNTAKILYLLYIGFTVAEAVALMIAGACSKLSNGEMLSVGENIFDAIVHAFGTAGTGGFSVRGSSIAYYGAAYQWIITAFMILFGINFNLYYLILLRKFKQAFGSRELWIFIGIIVVSTTAIAINLATAVTELTFTDNAHDVIRHSIFQVAAFISTTGYSSIPNGYNINNFPLLSLGILFLLMFIGGCAGSTGGGLKVSRVVILGKAVKKELRRVLHPRSANAVKFEGKILSDETLHGVTSYFGLYMLILAATFIVLCFDSGVSSYALAHNSTISAVETNITAAVSCINNIGPAYGVAASGYYMYNWFSKLIMSFAMLIGRLEIYPILLMFAPTTWMKR